MSLQISALPAGELRRIRIQGTDDHGNAFRTRLDGAGGAPLRCCLRDSLPGERIALIAYARLGRPGHYDEVGPVFVHGGECDGYGQPSRYPVDFRGRAQVFRTHLADGSIGGGRVVRSDEDQETAAAELLADPAVKIVHSRNIVHGCYMFAIGRSSAG